MDINKQIENLNAINNWCKSVSLNEIVYVENALFCNNRYYRISVSKCGIRVCENSKFSQWLHCVYGGNSLYGTKVGSELIYNWQNIKERIFYEIGECKRKQNIMENFVV